MIGFRLAADADQFLTIAKFRALRLLWARIEEAAGLDPQPIRVHAETAWRMMSRRDPWVNLLRTTLAVFSAGVGGADSIAVLPLTQAIGLPDAFARRLARNTQLVLLEEANLARVGDPAAGSGGLEALTEELARAAWAKLQQFEARGGAYAALADGSFQAEVAATRAARDKALARRKDKLTGVSEFPDLSEKPVSVLAPLPALAPPRPHGRFRWLPLSPHRPRRALRGPARHRRSRPRRPALDLPRHARPRRRLHRPRGVRPNLFEAGGISCARRRRLARRDWHGPARARDRIQGVRARRSPASARRTRCMPRSGRRRPGAEAGRRGHGLARR